MAEPRRQWTYIPPAWTGEQVEGGSLLPVGRYRMPDGTEQVSFGLPQSMLDAYRAMGFATGQQQDPNAPQGYVSSEALRRGGQGLAESAAVGSIASRAPAGALRSGMARPDKNALADFLKYNRQAESMPELIASARRDDLIQTVKDAVQTVKSGAWAAQQDAIARKLNQNGMLPLKEGTAVTPPSSYDMPGNWRVAGYWVDPQNPRRYGYKLANDEGATFDAPVSDPKIGYRTEDPTKFGGGFSARIGPRDVYATGQELQNYPRYEPRPDVSPQTISEINDLFGDFSNNSSIAANARPGAAVGATMSAARNEAPNYITPRSRELIEEYVNAALKPKEQQYEITRHDGDLTVHQPGVGFVQGTGGPDPKISRSHIAADQRGQGVGSALYRAFAEEAGAPFRSDRQVSREAAVMYEKMLPKYGYNVLRNPEARFSDRGGMNNTGAWSVPMNKPWAREHVYRVEPPGMKSTEFYANPLAGAIPLAWYNQEDDQ